MVVTVGGVHVLVLVAVVVVLWLVMMRFVLALLQLHDLSETMILLI